MLTPADVPERFRDIVYKTSGASFLVDPRGEVVARSERGAVPILTYEIDPAVIRSAKVAMDVAGHCARKDVFHLTVRGTSVFDLSPTPLRE